MQVTKISNRGVRFEFMPLGRWDLYCYLIIGEKRNYLIDTACGTFDAKMMNEYIENNCPKNPLIVINTHYHWDHIWGNCFFNDKNIVASQLCYDLTQENFQKMLSVNAEYVNGATTMRLPDITFTDKLTFYDDDITLFTSPGHTFDGICIYDGIDKTLYVGDNIGDNLIEVKPELENTKLEYMESLINMKNYDFDVLASGHNQILDKSFIDKIIKAL